jgi:SAM-dependent methyltransferase
LPDYDPAAYGDRMAEVYDEWFGTPADAEEAVAFLSDLAGRGRVLELGIGTGRVALPLAGLRLRQRWGGWRRERFTASSTSHVSVYKR